MCVHTQQQPELLGELGAHPHDPLPAGGGTPRLRAGQPGAHTPRATACLVRNASRRCWEAAPRGGSRGGLRRLRARLAAFTHLVVLSSLSLRS